MKKIALILIIAIFGVIGVSAKPEKAIGMRKAKAIALKQATGKVVHSETLKEDGKPSYLVDVKSTSGEITKIKIDSQGNVLDKSTVAATQAPAKHKKKHWWKF